MIEIPIDGVLLIDKPKGWTSHDAVNYVRRGFSIKKAGHAGTLDPIATGLLVLLLGRATKFSAELAGADKSYEGQLTLGAKTETGDAEGKVIAARGIAGIDASRVREVMGTFHGELEQIPPMFSAKKMNGRALYKLARKGIVVEREPRRITIKKMEITGIDLPRIGFSILSSKGTYIRQLCADIGDKLGCGGYMSELRRTASGRFTIDSAVTPEALMVKAKDASGIKALDAFIPVYTLIHWTRQR